MRCYESKLAGKDSCGPSTRSLHSPALSQNR
jgi:hypothetical protein